MESAEPEVSFESLVADPREFESTYFALRIGIVAAALLVMMAPLAARVFGHGVPPTISDSWYTDARMIFVLGLTAASGLLVVVRGDTLTEQTLLNVAGGLGLLVAGAACWPKDERGEALSVFDPDVARLNQYAIGALLVLGLVVWLVGVRLPRKIVGDGWKTDRTPRALLRIAPLLVLTGMSAWFVAAPDEMAHRAHGYAATAMFAVLGVVALLRTKRGTAFLTRIGDEPVDASLSDARTSGGGPAESRAKRFDWIYEAVAAGMLAVVGVALYVYFGEVAPGWVVYVEVVLLALFGVFWIAQTCEAWLERREGD